MQTAFTNDAVEVHGCVELIVKSSLKSNTQLLIRALLSSIHEQLCIAHQEMFHYITVTILAL